MLFERIRNYLKSVPRYRFLILGTTHPDALYIRQQGREDSWFFFRSHEGFATKKVWETLVFATHSTRIHYTWYDVV